MDQGQLEKATFAGGCFWCMQPFFDHLKGVQKTLVGYTAGHTPNPTYEDICSGQSGHVEAIEVTYDPKEVSYNQIIDVYWHNIDPTQLDGQFVDEGAQYRTVVFYHNEEQKRIAEQTKKELAASKRFDKPIVTSIEPAKLFFPAEDYHQKYYQKSSFRYNMYHSGTGREEYKHKIWGNQG